MNGEEYLDTVLKCKAILKLASSTSELSIGIKEMTSCLKLLSELLSGERENLKLEEVENAAREVTLNPWDCVCGAPLIEAHQLRLFRGFVILTRNLVAWNSISLPPDALILSTKYVLTNYRKQGSFYRTCLQSLFELLANLAVRSEGFKWDIPALKELFEESLDEDIVGAIFEPAICFMSKAVTRSDLIAEFIVVKQCNAFTQMLLADSSLLYDNERVHSKALREIWISIATSEACGRWLKCYHPNHGTTKLRILQTVIATELDSWSDNDLLATLSWVLPSLTLSAAEVTGILSQQESHMNTVENAHAQLMALLDMTALLLTNNAVKQVLERSDILETLVPLFRAIHENTDSQVKLNSPRSQEQAIESIWDFPGAKLLLIEIMTFISHKCFEAQEKMRELHGIELVLSNCVIDRLNPFIKEKSILCIKFLLESNMKNQELVRNLEARKAVNSDDLEKMGIELDIKEGQVRLKPKNHRI